MATFVLVPGFWLGGWAWEDVTATLREHGHVVYPVTLTGLGERRHLGNAEVNLDTHIQDVGNLIYYEKLQNVILVGHSYAGIVITGVADRAPDRLAKLIYADTAPLPDGMSNADFYPPDLRKRYEQRVAGHEGWKLPFPPWEELDQIGSSRDLDEAMREKIRERATDMPFGAARQRVRLKNPERAKIPKTCICCTFTSKQAHQLIEAGNPVFRELAGPEWTFIDLPTGHFPMFSKTKELTDIFLQEAESV